MHTGFCVPCNRHFGSKDIDEHIGVIDLNGLVGSAASEIRKTDTVVQK